MTPAAIPAAKLKLIYDMAEERYLRSLPPEHFMETPSQASQRKITLESFDVIHVARPDVQCFNELLVQYPRGADESRPGQVVPDNMVVVHPEPIAAGASFNTLLQPAGPLLVLEYVSKGNERKDYASDMAQYERELKVPYYLLFYPDNEELTVFRLTAGRYVSVPPNPGGRLPIPKLELEVALLGGWVRYWFRSELVPLPADLLRELNQAKRLLADAEQRADAERQARLAAEAELARLREELAKARGTQP